MYYGHAHLPLNNSVCAESKNKRLRTGIRASLMMSFRHSSHHSINMWAHEQAMTALCDLQVGVLQTQ